MDSFLTGDSRQTWRAPFVPPVTGEDMATELAVIVAVLVLLP